MRKEIDVLEDLADKYDDWWHDHLPEGWTFRQTAGVNLGLGNTESLYEVCNATGEKIGEVLVSSNAYIYGDCHASARVYDTGNGLEALKYDAKNKEVEFY